MQNSNESRSSHPAEQTLIQKRTSSEGPRSSKSLDLFQFYLMLLRECGQICRKHLSWEYNMALYNSEMRVILPCLEVFRCICRHLHFKYLRPQMSLQMQKLQIYMDFQKFWLQVSIAPRSVVPGAKKDASLKLKKHTQHVRAHVLPTAGYYLSSAHPALHFGENKLELSVGGGALVHWCVQSTWMKPWVQQKWANRWCVLLLPFWSLNQGRLLA